MIEDIWIGSIFGVLVGPLQRWGIMGVQVIQSFSSDGKTIKNA